MLINNDHDYEIINLHFEYLLTMAEHIGYPLNVIENRLIKSYQIEELENGNPSPFLYSNAKDLFSEIFNDSKNTVQSHIELSWTNKWITQAYFYLFYRFNMTFELLFAYLPIQKMKSMFNLYHEMDNSNLANYLIEQVKETNPLKLFLKKRKISLKTLSENTNIPLSTLSSYSQGSRSIKTMSLENGVKIASFLRIKVKSLLIN